MKRIFISLLIVAATTAVSNATFEPIVDTDSWTAGTDLLYQFYGADFSTQNGYAEVAVTNDTTGADGRRAMLWAADITSAGTFEYSFENMYSNYYQQYNYWMVYLLNDGSQIGLVSGPSYNFVPQDGVKILSDYGTAAHADENWHLHSYSLEISQQQVDSYDYIAFVMVGSKQTGQEMAYNNFATTVPEPTTIALLSLGSFVFFRPKRK